MNNPMPHTPLNKPSTEGVLFLGFEGSVLLGFVIGWCIIGLSYFACFVIFSVMSIFVGGQYGYTLTGKIMAASLALLPILVTSIAAFLLRKKGKPRTAKGVIAAIISFISLALLLLAACYGIITSMT
jgi:hypothetical protein